MREAAALLALWAFLLGPEALGAQEPAKPGREGTEHLRAILRATSVGRQLTIALRNGETFEASLAEVGDDSFGVWVTPDEETRRRLGLSGARMKRTIRYEEVESVRGAADIPEKAIDSRLARSADQLAYRMRVGDTVYVGTTKGVTFKGEVDVFDGDMLLINGRTLSLSGARGDKIEGIDLRVEDSLKNGVLIGAGIGASVGLLYCHSVDEGCGARVAAEALLWYGGAGAGLGALFDTLFHDRRPIYVAPGSPTESKLQVGLIVTRERKGLLVSWSF